MNGRRRERGTGPHLFEAGDYGLWNDTWYCSTPNGYLGNLAHHAVTEHEDGTITVSPSILVSLPANDEQPRRELWHGFLERGIWRQV